MPPLKIQPRPVHRNGAALKKRSRDSTECPRLTAVALCSCSGLRLLDCLALKTGCFADGTAPVFTMLLLTAESANTLVVDWLAPSSFLSGTATGSQPGAVLYTSDIIAQCGPHDVSI